MFLPLQESFCCLLPIPFQVTFKINDSSHLAVRTSHLAWAFCISSQFPQPACVAGMGNFPLCFRGERLPGTIDILSLCPEPGAKNSGLELWAQPPHDWASQHHDLFSRLCGLDSWWEGTNSNLRNVPTSGGIDGFQKHSAGILANWFGQFQVLFPSVVLLLEG